MLDDVIEKIDQSLPVIHEMCAVRKKQSKQKKSPTDRLPLAKAKRARAAFAEMADDSILTESGDDITDGPLKKINVRVKKSKAS